MKIAPLAEVKNQLSAYVQECQESPVVITRNGKPVAMLVAVKDEEDLDRLLLAHHPRFLQILEAGHRNVETTGGIPHKEFWASMKKRRTRKKLT